MEVSSFSCLNNNKKIPNGWQGFCHLLLQESEYLPVNWKLFYLNNTCNSKIKLTIGNEFFGNHIDIFPYKEILPGLIAIPF